MNREQYAEMLREIHNTQKAGGDIAACIEGYKRKYKYVYVYNDSCFKKIFGAEQNKAMAASFLNAVLKLDGADCISKLDFINPTVPGGPFVKSVTSDLVARSQDKRRVVIEVQHKGGKTFKDRLVFYMACHTMQNRVPGSQYELQNMDFIALQMFDTFPDSHAYRHCMQLKNQDNEIYYGKEILTVVEVEKFQKHVDRYVQDESRLALWLRAVQAVNDEKEDLRGNVFFPLLQSAAKLSNFDMGYLLTEAKSMTDHAYELEVEREEAREEGLAEGRAEGLAEGRAEGRAEGLAEGLTEGCNAKNRELAKGFRDDGFPVEAISKRTGLSVEEILAL